MEGIHDTKLQVGSMEKNVMHFISEYGSETADRELKEICANKLQINNEENVVISYNGGKTADMNWNLAQKDQLGA